ncbi:efflux RND transporter periplasmic adaptor subunit [Litchfieldia salsa]|uniref:Multidrug efflux pump subunit AcrA (Membrane-fusion protein) n=1 Tax=Litchfieldia salsa TaxID=930152 RepID=A0A1H0UE12_9BACI|nr:HlyD family efflux transporter periplasmic adaptor subunit [Litchfieldia salsa]SDP64477.1 Multidrug efflux pump subunit AcrA (membrane-fusion protein) [Litchfieldia salsa]
MKKKLWIWIVSIIGLLLIVGGVTYYVKGKSAEVASNGIEQVHVTVQKASERELIESILVTGKIVPENEQKVFLEPDKGSISEYKVVENQAVKAGEPLFFYDSSKIDREFTRAVRQRDLTKSRGKTEQDQISEINKRIAEAKKKVESGEGTPDEVNLLKAEKVQLEIQYEATKAEIATAQDEINEIATRKKEMVVVSKIDGIVVKVNQNVAQAEAGTPEPIVHVISSQPYKVIGTMSEFDAVKIKQGQPVIIRPKVYKDREWKGTVETVSQFPNEDGASGAEFAGGGGQGGNVTMYPFKVAITDDTSELRQGFHVSLEIQVKLNESDKTLVIPHTALMNEGGVDVAYILADGKLSRREVQTGGMSDEWIEVIGGVNLAEQVIITPYEGMYDGMEVVSYDEVE